VTDVVAGLVLAGLTAYLLFGGADFGAGVWHFVSRARPGEQRLIERAMGPVWEANHVWLIFVMVLTWTAFPPVFGAIAGGYWVPLTLAVAGIVIRGSAFAFRKVTPNRYAAVFAVSSLIAPFCLGDVAGAVADGRRGWLSRPALYTGALAVGLCVYLAAVYLTYDAHRADGPGAVVRFRRRALATGAVVGGVCLPGAIVLGVRHPVIALSAGAGLASLALLWRRHYIAVRVTAGLTVAGVLWGAAAHARLGLAQAAAPHAVLKLVLITAAVGAAILLPSLTWLYILFQRAPRGGGDLLRGEPGATG
jgi:cytochrome d ubiquinol oxidase subunit II